MNSPGLAFGSVKYFCRIDNRGKLLVKITQSGRIYGLCGM